MSISTVTMIGKQFNTPQLTVRANNFACMDYATTLRFWRNDPKRRHRLGWNSQGRFWIISFITHKYKSKSDWKLHLGKLGRIPRSLAGKKGGDSEVLSPFVLEPFILKIRVNVHLSIVAYSHYFILSWKKWVRVRIYIYKYTNEKEWEQAK